MANRRFIDFPIAASVGDNDIVLIWQDGLNKQTTKATLLQGSPQSLAGLTDVDIAGLTNGQILQYNSTLGKWENVDRTDINLSELGDVTIVAPTNGQVLVYNSSTSKWENSSGGYVPYTGAVTTVNLGAQSILAGTFVKDGGTSAQFLKADGSVDSTAYGTGSVTSVALTMPTAFSVANSPVTTAGTLAVTGAGTVSQYIRGDGSLADFPESSGGGSSVSYYLNGSVSQGTIGGVAYLELNKMPVFGAGTDITRNSNGYIASFITDAGDPNLLLIPAGNWNLETYFSASSSGGSPTFYVELYKYDGTTFTLLASSASAPELIAFGTNLNPYFSTLAVPQTTLTLTDRLALRYYVNTSGRTITLHTENNHLCQVITTFTTGLTALNGLTSQVQFFAVGTSGTDFNISSATDTHTFNLPTASATNRGALSSGDWSTFNAKMPAITFNAPLFIASGGQVGISQAATNSNGFLSNTDWNTFNNKENAITAGTTAQYFRGDKTFQTLNTSVVPELTNLYYTEARVNANTNVAANTAARHNAVTLGTANGLSLSTQVLSLGLASAGVTGALSGTDWSTFNSKQNALTNPVTGTGTTNYLPKFTGASTIGNSLVFDNGTNVGIGTTSPATLLQVFTNTSNAGRIRVTSTTSTAGNYRGYEFGNSLGFRGGIVQDESTEMISIFTPVGGQSVNITSGGNLLVGTTTDNGFKLDVNGTGRFVNNVSGGATNVLTITNAGSTVVNTETRLFLSTVTGNDRGAYISAIITSASNDNALIFATNSAGSSPTEKVRITNSGNVGIGTASPQNFNAAANQLVVGTSSGNNGITIAAGTNAFSCLFFADGTSGNEAFRGYIQYNHSTDGLEIGTAGSERMRITSGGNVGIGTTSPNVNGLSTALTINGSSTSGLEINANSVNQGYLIASTSAMVLNARTNIPLLFYTNDTERMRITSGGNVLIGTTTDGGQKLQVSAGNTSESSAHLNLVNSGIYSGFHFLDGTAYYIGQNSNFRSLRMYSGGSTGTGVNLAAGATSWGTYSDERLKTDLLPIENATEKVTKLRSLTGRYKTDEENKKRAFLIAQDVKEVLPEAIGEDLNSGLLEIRYTEIIPLLVASIKELKQEIDTLKN
jgi:hypothetical protein